MGLGAPALNTNQRRQNSGAPFPITSANNGLSVSPGPGGFIVLGQNVGQAGSPANFLNDREIPNQGFNLRLLGTGAFIATATPAISTGEAIQADRGIKIDNGFTAQIRLQPNPVSPLLISNANANVRIESSNAVVELQSQNIVCSMTNTGFFDIQSAGSVVRFRTLQNGNVMIGQVIDNGQRLQVNGGVSFSEAGFMLHAAAAMTDGAGAALGTLANAPVAGNPTKWIAFDDAGTTRFIPAW
jgi:hypothetical protein